MKKRFHSLLHTPKGNRIISLCILIFIAILFLAVHIFSIKFTGILPECTIRKLTGLRCPGCGGTRCAEALLDFNIASAFYYNPYITAAVFVLLIMYIKYVINAFSSNYKPCEYDISVFTAIFIPVSIILFVFIRNTQVYQMFLY